MKIDPFEITSRVWEWEGKGAWHFVTIDLKTSKQIKSEYMYPKRGFGSIPVNVTLGLSKWKTSIFPEKEGTYLLPIKRSIRDTQGIKEGNKIKFTLQIII